MVPPYRIVTPRLELRCWAPGDAPALNALIARANASRAAEDAPASPDESAPPAAAASPE